jgi:hypothetical protein
VSKCASRDYHDKQTNKNGTNDYPVSHCTCSFNIVFTKKTENEFYHSKMKIQLGKLPLLIMKNALCKSGDNTKGKSEVLEEGLFLDWQSLQ